MSMAITEIFRKTFNQTQSFKKRNLQVFLGVDEKPDKNINAVGEKINWSEVFFTQLTCKPSFLHL